jgi:hypothetical protein
MLSANHDFHNDRPYISSKILIRSWMGGCVENRFSNQWFDSPGVREG